MSSKKISLDAASTLTPQALSPALTLLFAAGAGLSVATLYYCQPMLGVIGAETGAAGSSLGWIPTLTQLGYASGLLLLAPLGDRFDRRTIILVKAAILLAALLVAGASPSIGFLLAASFCVGVSATLAQDIIPAAVTLAPESSRGKVVGTVMTGLLLGILLSRVVSGLIAEHSGWRSVFILAAISIAVLGALLWRNLPRFAPTITLSYANLMGSLATLWRQHPRLRRAALAQGLLAVGFSAFWSTLAVMLHGAPFHMGSAAAGLFGIAGAAGAIGASLAGRAADRFGQEWLTRFAAALAIISFAAMGFMPLLSTQSQVWLLAASAVGFDIGVQASLVAHQTIVYGIAPESRSRLNAILMVGVFVGMASGAALASQVMAAWGWQGVVALCTAAAALALAVRLYPQRGTAG